MQARDARGIIEASNRLGRITASRGFMPDPPVVLCLLALAGCATNARSRPSGCAGQQGDAYTHCVEREQAKLAAAQQLPTGGGSGY